MPKISVVIPAYNEEKNIKETIERVRKTSGDYEIIIVDDGSRDRTYEIAKQAGAKTFRLERNSGKGAAFRRGIEEASGDIIAQIDADSQFLPEELSKLIGPLLKDEADITLGSRFIKGAYIEEGALSFRNRIGNYVVSLLTSIACMQRITDVQAGFKAFKKENANKLDFKEDHFGYEPELVILASKNKLRIKEVPVLYKKRRGGQSNINFIRDAYRITKTILKTILL